MEVPEVREVRSVPVGEIRRLGDHALLVGVEGPEEARRLVRAVRAAAVGDLAEVVGGLATVMVAFEPTAGGMEQRRMILAQVMEEALAQPVGRADHEEEGNLPAAEGPLRFITCAFDGPDLAEVAALAGCTTARVVELVTAQPLTVAVVGFSPGFAYLEGLPAELPRIPRRARPRARVAAGSVALANGYAAVYPTASPGGWQLIGRTGAVLFDPTTPPYAQLAPGDRVQFTVAAPNAGLEPVPAPPADAQPPAPVSARAVFVVDEPGLRSVLQDGGRRGVAALGVPGAGPADPDSHQLANQLVGNPPDAGTLEVTARGPTLRCLSATFVAVVGAAPEVRLDGQPVAGGRVVPVSAGQELRVGSIRRGFRCYIGVAGGLVGPQVFGSCASDQLCGLGPGPLASGARLFAGSMQPPLGDHLGEGSSPDVAEGEPIVLRVVPGPHPERFAPGVLTALASTRFSVGAESNRVGLRLRSAAGDPPLGVAPVPAAELDSQGMVTGAVQVPPDGDPVILLSDHATLGGYPVAAVVVAADLGLLGQCAPGHTVVLVPIDHDHAAEALRRRRRQLETAVVGHYPLALA